MVKETDLKSVGHCPRRFEPCYHRFFFDTVAEWLRRWTANPLGNALASSNLVGVVFFGDIDYCSLCMLINLISSLSLISSVVERGTCNAKVGGSKPPLGYFFINIKNYIYKKLYL